MDCDIYTHGFCSHSSRLILYFPVSALVTLFGNILQNPQDSRARSDVRLMNLVVSFLSMLSADEGNGGVKRMLGVCSEFERIAKVVLDKAEQESSSRRKRKTIEDPNKATKGGPSFPQKSTAVPPPTPMPTSTSHTPAIPPIFSPNMGANLKNNPNGFSPPVIAKDSPNSGIWAADFTTNGGGEYLTPPNGNDIMTPFADIQGYTNGNELHSPPNLNTFQQPFVPQDLWQMPMTFEWDWADMTQGTYPSFENGAVGDGVNL